MGWAFYEDYKGRPIGYGVEAVCDEPGCDTKINRGLSYCCGDMPGGGELGCGEYFCSKHLKYYPQLCSRCWNEWEPEPDEPEDPATPAKAEGER